MLSDLTFKLSARHFGMEWAIFRSHMRSRWAAAESDRRARSGTCLRNAHGCGHLQVLEIWKMLLDPESMTGALEKNRFLEIFYDECIGKLSAALVSGGTAKVR